MRVTMTRGLRLGAALVLAAGLGAGEAAWAQTQVVYVRDSYGYDPPAASDFHAQMIAAGATSSVSTGSLPSSLSPYRVVLVGPRQTGSWSSSEISQLSAFARTSGVTLVIIAEHTSYIGSYASTNALLSGLGISSSFISAADGGCSETGTVLSSTGYMTGVSQLLLGASGRISVGSGGTALFSLSGGTQVAAHGNVVLVGDSNVFGGCGSSSYGSNTKLFWRNLYTRGCTPTTWYLDADGDSWGGTTTTSACSAPSGYVARTGDCNDSAASIFPGATEVTGDEVDQSCDGREVCFADTDNDGWRLTSTVASADVDCADSGEARASEPTLDCDDLDALTFPGATEIVADGKDQSCDGREVCFVDADGDRWRIGSTVTSSDPDCSDPGEALSSVPATDCDDADRATYPGAPEVVADEKDQSCDGREICYVDADDDGWRIGGTLTSADADCRDSGEARAGEPDGDCNDRDRTVYPGAPEVAYDGIDQDCNGEDLCDVDLDGYDADAGTCLGADCDDDDPAINPGVDELWYDGVDADCDGWSDFDADLDGFDAKDYGGEDCDDTDFDVNPEVDEIWYDGDDQDCDGRSDFDQDKDGFDSSEYGGEDCIDTDDTVFPGAPELPDGIDNDCNGVDEDDDTDGDGLADEVELDLGTDPLNPDSDGDGLIDGFEVGEDQEDPRDSDTDGIIDALDVDDDGDGLLTAAELRDGALVDTDGDGDADYLDLDSDGDGYSDEVEGLVDSDRDGTPDFRDLDSDDDTRVDADERDTDTDGDGLHDRVDPDDDGDGFASAEERSWENPDIDGDGEPNELDPDADGDGRTDQEEGTGDLDCDEVPNVQDPDDADGPCGVALGLSFQSSACRGASVTGTAGGWWLAAFAVVGLGVMRRRR